MFGTAKYSWTSYNDSKLGIVLTIGCETHPLVYWRRNVGKIAEEHNDLEFVVIARDIIRLAKHIKVVK